MVFDPVIQDDPGSSAEYPPGMIPISFYSGDYKIVGSFFLTNGKGPHPTVILLHGFPGNENNFDIAHAAKRAGWNVFVFHYRGMWGSAGNFTWSNALDDLREAIRFVNKSADNKEMRIAKDKIVLVGHSMGGFAALLVSIEFPAIKNVASLAGFNFGNFAKVMEVEQYVMDASVEQLEESVQFVKGATADKLINEMITLKNQFNLLNYTEELSKKNLLLVRAKFDNIAPADIHCIPLVKAIKDKQPAMFIDVTLNSGHSFSDARIKLTRVLINWLNKITF